MYVSFTDFREIRKWLDRLLLKTSYLVAIATGFPQTLSKCVSVIKEQLLKTACPDSKINALDKIREKTYVNFSAHQI